MSSIIGPDDLEVGMKITVHTGPTDEVLVSSGGWGFDSFPSTVAREDNSGKGTVLEIRAIMLPYIVVKEISRYNAGNDPHKMDTRGRKFMRVTPEYEAALLEENE